MRARLLLTPLPRLSDRASLAGLTALMVTVSYLAYSPAAVPLIDDWLYAWSVGHFLETGTVRMVESSSHYPVAQILWGALFSQLFGFSFGVLRLSTPLLAWGSLLAFYLTLRELGIRPLPACLGTIVLLCNPVVFMLDNSFMTDAPFLSIMNGALLWYARWTLRGRTQDLALGSGLAIVAFLIRQPGATLAVVPVAYLVLMRRLGGTRRVLPRSQQLCLLVPFLGIGLTLEWVHAIHGETRVYRERVEDLSFVLTTSGWIYLRELVHIVLYLGLVLWPPTWGIVTSLSLCALV